MVSGFAPASNLKHIRESRSEYSLAMLWQKAHTLPEGLVTEDGKRFRVIYPGRRNARAGPDFWNAVIATDAGDTVTGDVELHLRAPDWYSHRHESDRNYNGVILRVVLWPKGRTASMMQSGMEAPIASVANVATVLEQTDLSENHLLTGLKLTDVRDIGDVLDQAGDERFLAKSRGSGLEIADVGPEETLYRGLMETLGYASNRSSFRELAKRVPFALLTSVRDEPPQTRILALKAMLLGAAGLLSSLDSPEQPQDLRRLRRHLPRVRPMSAGQWRTFRVRPANRPVRRIIGACHLVDRYIETGLIRKISDILVHEDSRSLTQGLTVRPYIGEGRARDMAVNVVLPFLHCYADIDVSASLRRRSVDLYRSFPKLQDNDIVREMNRLMGDTAAAKYVTNARRQQGLIHLYKRLYAPGANRSTA